MKCYIYTFLFFASSLSIQGCPEPSTTVHIQNYDGAIYLHPHQTDSCPDDCQLYHINNNLIPTTEDSNCNCVSKQPSSFLPINRASQCSGTCYNSGKGYNNLGTNYNSVGTSYNKVGTYNNNLGKGNNNVRTCNNNFGTGCCNVGTDCNDVGTSCNDEGTIYIYATGCNSGSNYNNIGTSYNNKGICCNSVGPCYSNVETNNNNDETCCNNVGTCCNNFGTSYNSVGADNNNLLFSVPLCQNTVGMYNPVNDQTVFAYGIVKKNTKCDCQCPCHRY